MKSFKEYFNENYYTDGLKKISDLKKANSDIDKVVRSTIALFKDGESLESRRKKIKDLKDKVIKKYTKVFHTWALLQTQRLDFPDKKKDEKELIKKVLNQSSATVAQIFDSIVEKNVKADLKALIKRGI